MKEINSTYSIGKRTKKWTKLINYQYIDCYIKGMRKEEFGILLCDKSGSYLGVMEFMTPNARKELYQTVKKHAISETNDYITFDPYIPCQVKFRNWTKQGRLRIPSFVKWLD